ncbi:hypothetical protein J2Z17_001631 [Rhizobium halophytocola]|uniref:Uncharacterized protein n=1 Tax=Rhizobium halophytocola TaxID=735519 RepID=A0ABS4DX02_9HYPH|nr:hypothetical protein [Rhizobium halophytocola]
MTACRTRCGRNGRRRIDGGVGVGAGEMTGRLPGLGRGRVECSAAGRLTIARL